MSESPYSNSYIKMSFRGLEMMGIGSKQKMHQLAKGHAVVGIDTFAEGPHPRKLFHVTLGKE